MVPAVYDYTLAVHAQLKMQTQDVANKLNAGCCDQSKTDQFYIDNEPKRQQGLCVLSE